MDSIIYEPAEDSFFFRDFLQETFKDKDCSKLSFLDMGCGSGILAKTAKELGFYKILATDINKKALEETKEDKIEVLESNLFENIKEKFDVICFNAPYLPRDFREPKESQIATTGGKKGDEISIEFLRQAKNHLNKNGKIFLLISSLTPMTKIKEFNYKNIRKKKIDFEELIILEFDSSFS